MKRSEWEHLFGVKAELDACYKEALGITASSWQGGAFGSYVTNATSAAILAVHLHKLYRAGEEHVFEAEEHE